MVIMSTCIMSTVGANNKPKRPNKFNSKLKDTFNSLSFISDLNTPIINLALDGLNSGIPTATTSTITPTTLRDINEEIFVQFPSDVDSHENEAGFVPPPLPMITSAPVSQGCLLMTMADCKSLQGGSTRVASEIASSPDRVAVSESPIVQSTANLIKTSKLSNGCPPARIIVGPSSRCSTPPIYKPSIKKNTGGRRPVKAEGISPQEEVRRQMRRERNKQAAARCRKRRMDRTNELLERTNALENEKQNLQLEIQQLQNERGDLELFLKEHRPSCKEHRLWIDYDVDNYVDPKTQLYVHQQMQQQQSSEKVTLGGITISIKSEPTDVPISESSLINSNKRIALGNNSIPRPTTLAVPSTCLPNHHPQQKQQHHQESFRNYSDNTIADMIPSTPSSVIPFNFESLMDGGTGLTPSCSTQHRTLLSTFSSDLSSPDSGNIKFEAL